MGIVKIGHRGASGKNHGRQSPCTWITGKEDADEVHGSDLAEVGCELAVVGGQTCSVPYDMFDLPGLKDVLSLETWNSCLTEEERLHLSSYLPDIDHGAFVLTMKELLGGDDLFFGSPLEKIFRRLQGGFYSLQVTPAREGLRFLQKQGWYHSLRLYHESMARKFADMSKAWSSCPTSATVEERIRIWNSRNCCRKPVLLVDLNAFPAEEDTLHKADRRVEGLDLHSPAIDLNRVAVNTKPKGKGVLKVRSMEANATSTGRMQTLPGNCWERIKRVPKGVLKIKPKCDPFGQPEGPMTNPIRMSAFESPPSVPAFKSYEENAGHNLAYHHPIDGDGIRSRGLEQPGPLNDEHREEVLKMGVESFSDSHICRKKKKMSSSRFHNAPELQAGVFPLKSNQRSRMGSEEANGIGGICNGDNIWLNSDKHVRVLCPNSVLKESQLQKLTSVHHTVPGESGRVSTVGMFPQYIELPEPGHKDRYDGGLITTSESKVLSEVEREIIFPITYKRKKTCTKFSIEDAHKQPAMVANLESMESNIAECNPIGKVNTVKIKVKGWNNHNPRYKQRFLNGLQHGSPST